MSLLALTWKLSVDGGEKEVLCDHGDQVPSGDEDGGPAGLQEVKDDAAERRSHLGSLKSLSC